MNDVYVRLIESWAHHEGNVSTMDEILEWIGRLNRDTVVKVEECSIDGSTFWFYDEINGEILNRKRSFFQIKGIQQYVNNEMCAEQPVIIQREIGYLGIIVKVVDGVLNFLMQAKIEPGNVNRIQISPTIQATKSNFTKAHGGKFPDYLEYFENASRYEILVDQIQSEQASRFYKKRNRNMIICVADDVPVLPNFKWMTLGQIKRLMAIDNLVNMDTHTVLSGISFVGVDFSAAETERIRPCFSGEALYRSMFSGSCHESIVEIYHYVNNYKMFNNTKVELVPLSHLTSWKTDQFGVVCRNPAFFSVRFYDITIEGREVMNWIQPLFKAIGSATFALLYCENGGQVEFLVAAKPEIGCMDMIELGPSVQFEALHDPADDNVVEALFRRYSGGAVKPAAGGCIDRSVISSEEGGRFYHEQNRNHIIRIDRNDIPVLPAGYFWVNYRTLATLVKTNNCLNIQLRKLLALIDI